MSIPGRLNHFLQAASLRPRGRSAGFSMTEMVITISILGILSGVVMISMGDSFLAGQETLAVNRMEMLNRALHQFSQGNYEMIFTARPDSAADELFVLRTLEYRIPNESKAKAGSPYVTPYYNPPTSSNVADFRIRWNGRLYELLRPGQTGSGLKMVFDGSDMTAPFAFPPNFQMAGR